jgi:hypothetical protein
MGWPSLANARRLWAAVPIGSAFALAIVLIDQQFGPRFGGGRVVQDALLAGIILVVNTALMYMSQLRLTSLVPGMFLAFASTAPPTSAASASTGATRGRPGCRWSR